MAGSHTPFAVVNRVGNPLVRAVLRSPAHGLLSGHLALLTVTGRRSGRAFTFPVGYHREGERVTIGVGSPERFVVGRVLEFVLGGLAVRTAEGALRQELADLVSASAR